MRYDLLRVHAAAGMCQALSRDAWGALRLAKPIADPKSSRCLQATTAPVPVVYWLSGLTCTDENFAQKSGFAKAASELGLCVVMPDTSPRGVTIEGADDSYDFGSGAGFYVDATEPKWAEHYKMYSYVRTNHEDAPVSNPSQNASTPISHPPLPACYQVTAELPALVAQTYAGKVTGQKSIFGHSMGGHGALTILLKNPADYASASAFAPICHPTACPWGEKAFGGYLGSVRV